MVSNEPLVGALIGVAVATAARFAGCFGGYFGASVSPVILAYVLAASVPAPNDAIPDRLLGWLVAGLAATLAALVLWPRRERMLIREAAATAAGAVADALTALRNRDEEPAPALAAADVAIAKLVAAASVPRRPAGPSAHDAAFAFLVDQLERAAILLRATSEDDETTSLTLDLTGTAASAFREIERMMVDGTVSDRLDMLVGSCVQVKQAVLSNAVDELGRGEAVSGVLDEIDACFPERLLLLLGSVGTRERGSDRLGSETVRRRGDDPAGGPDDLGAARHRRPLARARRGERGAELGLGAGELAGRDRGRDRDLRRGRAPARSRVLGRARDHVGAPIERVRHRPHRTRGIRRHRSRVRGVSGPARARRLRSHRAVDHGRRDVLPLRLHPAGRRLRRRAGVLHDRGGRTVQPHPATGVADGPGALREHPARVRCERRGRSLLLAPARIGGLAGQRLGPVPAPRAARCRSASST